MTNVEFDFHPPSRGKRFLEKIGLREVGPRDIVPPGQLDALVTTYPDLGGDSDIGRSDSEGRCQSWRDDPGWWIRFIAQQGRSTK